MRGPTDCFYMLESDVYRRQNIKMVPPLKGLSDLNTYLDPPYQ